VKYRIWEYRTIQKRPPLPCGWSIKGKVVYARLYITLFHQQLIINNSTNPELFANVFPTSTQDTHEGCHRQCTLEDSYTVGLQKGCKDVVQSSK